jgi:hypothetical protein
MRILNVCDCPDHVVEAPDDIMTVGRFDEILQETLASIQSVLGNKAKEYAQNGDRLFNFRLAANVNETTMPLALWGMATKHLVSVMDLVNGRLKPKKAVVDEKIGDLINYLILLKAALEDSTK